MNNWPKWLPYPISWIRAFALNSVLIVLFWSRIPFRHSSSVVIALVSAWVAVPFLFAFFHWAVAAVAEFLLVRLPVHPNLSTVRQYLGDRLPELQRPHWREGLNAFIVALVAFLASAFIVSFVPVPSKEIAYEYDMYLLRRSMLRLSIDLMPIAMVIIAAYLYQYDLLVRRWRAAKTSAKSQPQKPVRRSPVASPPDPVEQELNQMKFGSGMTRTAKRASTTVAETPNWYVFRSGQAEGPYTKLQLLEVQAITAPNQSATRRNRMAARWRNTGTGSIPD